ncbi:MAG TPA: hypothetical protein PKH07_00740 [bacterium]|nr:hypothetical protein [bacterium]
MNRERKKRILVADSDRARLTALTVILESDDFEVFAASDADTCVAEARSRQPNLLILNTSFGSVQDDQSVLSAMKADSVLERIPILLLSEGRCNGSQAPADASDSSGRRREIKHPHDLIRQIDLLLRKAQGASFPEGRR